MQRRRNIWDFVYVNILLNISAILFIISIAVIITINFKPLYYWDINLLKIPDSSGYSKEVVKENYNVLIKYCSPFFKGNLTFPSLDMSETGRIHFEEVKAIFNKIYLIAFISFIIMLIIITFKLRNGKYKFLRTIAVISSLLPIIVCTSIAINFGYTFELFHKIFFNNDYWEFDPVTDPVINILPSTFFLHCAVMIVILIMLFNLIIYRIYKKLKEIHDDQYIVR